MAAIAAATVIGLAVGSITSWFASSHDHQDEQKGVINNEIKVEEPPKQKMHIEFMVYVVVIVIAIMIIVKLLAKYKKHIQKKYQRPQPNIEI